MLSLVLGALAVLLVGHLFVGWSIRGILRDCLSTQREPNEESGEWQRAYRDLEDRFERLPARWEEIRSEADRIFKKSRSVEERARHAVARTQAELEEVGLRDDPLEQLASELGIEHVGGGRAEAVPALRQGMEGGNPADPESQIAAARRRKFGG